LFSSPSDHLAVAKHEQETEQVEEVWYYQREEEEVIPAFPKQ
jgi:hypothetical protein